MAEAAAPTPLAKLFASKHQAAPAAGEGSEGQQMPQNQKQQLGSLVAAAELWPAQGLPKGAAVPSPTLRDALARPEPGASLLVYAACEQVPCSDNSNSVHRVYLRMCQRRSAVGDVAAAALLLPLPRNAAGVRIIGGMPPRPRMAGLRAAGVPPLARMAGLRGAPPPGAAGRWMTAACPGSASRPPSGTQ